jgi:hypothetical protein
VGWSRRPSSPLPKHVVEGGRDLGQQPLRRGVVATGDCNDRQVEVDSGCRTELFEKRPGLKEQSCGVVVSAEVAVVPRLALQDLDGNALEGDGIVACPDVVGPRHLR